MENKILAVIDAQEGLFSNPEYEMYESEKLLQNINELINKARESDVPIIFIRHNDGGLLYESAAWQIHNRLDSTDKDIYVDKQHCDSFFETDLMKVLESKKIKQIVACGLQTEYCVDTFCRSAFGNKFKTFLVKDAHSTCDNKVLTAKQIIDHHNESLGGSFVELVSTATVEF